MHKYNTYIGTYMYMYNACSVRKKNQFLSKKKLKIKRQQRIFASCVNIYCTNDAKLLLITLHFFF